MTTIQIQYLLAYLGYDVIPDGIPGPQTEAATLKFQKDYGGIAQDGTPGTQTQKALRDAVAYNKFKPPDAATEDSSVTGTFWDEIEYFTREEFRCPCGKCGGFPVEPKEQLVREVNGLRKALGVAVIVVPPDGHSGGSGVRCAAYNATLKGSVPNSRHLLGEAADVKATKATASAIESHLARRKAAGAIRYWYCISPGSYHMDVE